MIFLPLFFFDRHSLDLPYVPSGARCFSPELKIRATRIDVRKQGGGMDCYPVTNSSSPLQAVVLLVMGRISIHLPDTGYLAPSPVPMTSV